jgi:rRNA maturation RNase YbeY
VKSKLTQKRTSPQWQSYAARRIQKITKLTRAYPALKKLGPKGDWSVEVYLIGSKKMIELNSKYRGKSYATDVLSFPASEPFRSQGFLGDLIICLPTLKKQAKKYGLKPERELDILMTHGILHLLGLDHELGEAEAIKMARWEARILKLKGLIDRSNSGMDGS